MLPPLLLSLLAAPTCLYLLRVAYHWLVFVYRGVAERPRRPPGGVVLPTSPNPSAPRFDAHAHMQKPAHERERDVPCWDPATMESLGVLPAMGPDAVRECVQRGRAAQGLWRRSSFGERRVVLRSLLAVVVDNAMEIAMVACRDSGKTVVDAMFGEILVTCEKLRWTIANGEDVLQPEQRWSGLMNLHKTSRVEYVPVGVVGAIVPFNYPFHNMLNPIVSALFAGNAIVIKVSEFSSWSGKVYEKLVRECLVAAHAPPDLVQVVTGYGAAGHALVTCGVDKVIFVGSVGVGKRVMEAASTTLTPVVLELGGKDPFIVCADADVSNLAQLACRGVFQNMGQNCAGPERFFVHDAVYANFCARVVEVVKAMKTGEPLGALDVDCGACCHPLALAKYQQLVDDATSKGAKVLVGGTRCDGLRGQFFAPTVLVDVTPEMEIANEEVFGPIMCVFRVRSDDEAVRLANASRFALSSCAFSKSDQRAAAICAQLEAGMSSVNDLEGTTYLSQSLPFGGFKESGFGRFAGVEGLRGMCNVRSVVRNRPLFSTPAIPPEIAYPSNGNGPAFCVALVQLLYGSVWQRIEGCARLAGVGKGKPATTTKKA